MYFRVDTAMNNTLCSLIVQAQYAPAPREENQMSQGDSAAPTAAAPVPAEPQSKPPAVGKPRSPQAALGIKSDLLAQRLAEQAATTQRLPAENRKSYLELGASAVAALGELAPANGIEALLATQMVASHN